MGNTTRIQIGFMSLPRETCDEIYAHLLTSSYWIDRAPSLIRSDLNDDRQKRSYTRYPFAWDVGSSPLNLHVIQMPSDRTAILQVNKTIAAEAGSVLYQSSTFVFNYGPVSFVPSAMELDNIEAKNMRNIEVDINLYKILGGGLYLLSARKLLSFFAGNSALATSALSMSDSSFVSAIPRTFNRTP